MQCECQYMSWTAERKQLFPRRVMLLELGEVAQSMQDYIQVLKLLFLKLVILSLLHNNVVEKVENLELVNDMSSSYKHFIDSILGNSNKYIF